MSGKAREKAPGAVERLAMDFRRWGEVRVKRVKRAVIKYGMTLNEFAFDGKG